MSVYDYTFTTGKGEAFDMKSLRGKVFVVVNTATGCGFTPQYEGLEKLYQKYHDQGFEVIDIPCNQFGHQAPGTDDEIHEFCTGIYHTTFARMAKADVNGENELPLYTYLKEQQPTEEIQGLKNKAAMKSIALLSSTCKKPSDIKWNFTKFLIDKDGNVVKRFDPTFNPDDMEEDIKKLL